ncbi:MAG: caspase family protein [Saprospirales bacterium]|nr:caspase family protein [Saprospirales bacterium]
MPEPSKGIGKHDQSVTGATTFRRKSFLLAIGIDEYAHAPRLYNAVQDAKEFVAILQEKYQFDPQYTTELYDQNATRRNIYQALDKLVDTLTQEDNLVIYFSGHGEYRDQMDEGYWMPVDAERGAFFDFIPNQQIQHYLKRIPSHHSFVVVDSCFSGTLFASRNLGPTERLETVPSRWLLTSGRKEPVSDGKPGDHSPFAENILLFLKKNQQSTLPISRLIDDVVHATAANAKQTRAASPFRIRGTRVGSSISTSNTTKPAIGQRHKNRVRRRHFEIS